MSDTERRRHHRLPASRLTISVKKIGLLGHFKKPTTAKAIDFTKHGMAFLCNEAFETLDHLDLNLRLGDQEVNGVIGLVCATAPKGQATRYSVEFDHNFNKRMQSPEVSVTLKDIEETLSEASSSKEQSPPPLAP